MTRPPGHPVPRPVSRAEAGPALGLAGAAWPLFDPGVASGRVALRDAASGRTLTYAAVAARARALAGALAARGVGAGDRVAALSRGRPEVFELLAACGRLGAILAPLSWRAASRELAAIAADCAPAAVVCDAASAEDARAVISVSGCRTVIVMAGAAGAGRVGEGADAAAGVAADVAAGAGADILDYEAACAQAADADAGSDAGGADAADRADAADAADAARAARAARAGLLLYTSGTTGTPKGALLSWRQIEFNARATAALCGLGAGDSTLVFLPLFHTGGLNCLATPLLSVGGEVVVMPAFDPARALDVMEERGITAIIAVPTIYQALLDAGLARRSLPRLRWLLVGGAPCPDALLDAYDRAGHPLSQGYGLTEVGPNCFTLGVGAPRGSVGVPVAGTEARLVDVDDRGQPVIGAGTGELQLRGPHVTLGYWSRPADTAAVLSADGWFRTGDIARRDDAGFYAIVGRVKDMFISGGENVYPAEVERALLEHPDIAQVAVVGVPDPRWGEVGLAVCVPAAGVAPTDEQLRAHARERLAGYKVPRHWRLVSALPLTATGKVAKAALRERYAPRDEASAG